jgi:tetratricopeptide (TPR) repeat protein
MGIRSSFKNHKIRTALIVVGVVFLGVAGISAVLIYQSTQPPVVEQDTIRYGLDTTKAAENSAEYYNKAIQVAKTEGATAGQEFIDVAIEKADNDQDKATLYSIKSDLATSEEGGSDYDAAVKYAQEAEELYPTKETALALAFYETERGNIEEAIKYYELALERYGSYEEANAMDQSDMDYIRNEIAGLRA